MIDRVGEIVGLEAKAFVDFVHLAVRWLGQIKEVGRVELHAVFGRQHVQSNSIRRVLDPFNRNRTI